MSSRAARSFQRRRRVHRPAVPAARRHAVGPAAQAGAAPVPEPPLRPVLQARRLRALPRRARRARRRPRERACRPRLQPPPRRAPRLVRLLRVRGRPRGGARAAGRRAGLAARARDGADGRPRRLHHERRVRAGHRGPRARRRWSASRGIRPTTSRCWRAPGWRRSSTCSCGSSRSPTASRCSRSCRARRRRPRQARRHDPPHIAPRLRKDLDVFAEIYNRAWRRNFGFVPLREGGSATTTPRAPTRLRPRLVHDRRGRRRADRDAITIPTSTRCCAG